MKTKKPKSSSTSFLLPVSAMAALVGLLCLPLLTQAQGYVEPEGSPPFSAPDRTPGVADSPIEFLNGSSGEQRKTGSLILGESYGAGSLVTGTYPNVTIAYYTCDDDYWIDTILRNDPNLNSLTTYYYDPLATCGNLGALSLNALLDRQEVAATAYDVIIMEEPKLVVGGPTLTRVQNIIQNGALVLMTGAMVDLSGNAQGQFAGVKNCQSSTAAAAGCFFTATPSATPPAGTATAVNHGAWAMVAGDQFARPPESPYEGIMASGGSVSPIIDVPYDVANPGNSGVVGLLAHWQFGSGWIYWMGDIANQVPPATPTDCTQALCLNNSLTSIKQFIIKTVKKINGDPCLGSACAKLCLNASAANGLNDSNCIRNWSDIASFVGGPFLRLLNSGQQSEVDPGFAAVQSNGSQVEYMSLIGEANPNVAGSVGIRARSTASQHYAGMFWGRLAVRKAGTTTELCLNGPCLTSWAALSPAPADSINLQPTNTLIKQNGNVGLGSALVAGSIVLGVPSATTPTLYSCGDGVCSSENSERIGNCSADCQ